MRQTTKVAISFHQSNEYSKEMGQSNGKTLSSIVDEGIAWVFGCLRSELSAASPGKQESEKDLDRAEKAMKKMIASDDGQEFLESLKPLAKNIDSPASLSDTVMKLFLGIKERYESPLQSIVMLLLAIAAIVAIMVFVYYWPKYDVHMWLREILQLLSSKLFDANVSFIKRVSIFFASSGSDLTVKVPH